MGSCWCSVNTHVTLGADWLMEQEVKPGPGIAPMILQSSDVMCYCSAEMAEPIRAEEVEAELVVGSSVD